MSRPRRPIVVACFGNGAARGLALALQRWGFEPEILAEPDWTVARVQQRIAPTILYLHSSRYAPQRLWQAINRSNVTPSLTVLPHRALAWDPNLLNISPEFVNWPCGEYELKARLDRALKSWTPPSSTDDALSQTARTPLGLVGQSEPFRGAMRRIARVAQCDAPVLIEGETGVGKELAARAVHYLGSRQHHPFVPINCGALPDTLVENELFGHVRGAYTDAKESRGGLVAQAEGGTLFFDEVEALSPRAQVVLLRFLQDRHYSPLGSRSPSHANVRIVAASNADLHALTRQGQFREDLLYRLSVVVIRLPPLRDRRADVRPLAEEFLRQACARYKLPARALHPTALEWMEHYSWPGNVRELENLIHQACVVSEGPWIHLSAAGAEHGGRTREMAAPHSPRSFRQAKAELVSEFERRYLESMLRDCGGNVTEAARRAGKERRALGKLLKRHGLDRRAYS